MSSRLKPQVLAELQKRVEAIPKPKTFEELDWTFWWGRALAVKFRGGAWVELPLEAGDSPDFSRCTRPSWISLNYVTAIAHEIQCALDGPRDDHQIGSAG